MREEVEAETDSCCIYCFTPQMPTTFEMGPGQRQVYEVPYRSTTCLAEAQALAAWCSVLPDALAGSWITISVAGT